MITNQIKSDALKAELDLFLANGGAIQFLPVGFSGELSKGWNNQSKAIEMLKPKKKITRNRPAPNAEPRAIAMGLGLTKFEGTACLVCGSTIRYVSNVKCVACTAKHSKAYERERTTMKRNYKVTL